MWLEKYTKKSYLTFPQKITHSQHILNMKTHANIHIKFKGWLTIILD